MNGAGGGKTEEKKAKSKTPGATPAPGAPRFVLRDCAQVTRLGKAQQLAFKTILSYKKTTLSA
jgi:hypothetical protein